MPNQGHEKAAAREAEAVEAAGKAGWAHAVSNGKKRDNPYPGGSPEWWAWNNAYNNLKNFHAQLLRQRQREDRQRQKESY